jgi:thiamine-phosphate pyrophosphorylase
VIKKISDSQLYVILDTSYAPLERLVGIAKKVVDAGCSLIQLRDKKSSAKDIFKIVTKIKDMLPSQVILILNDYVEIAKETGVDGVHLGQEDMSVSSAREILGTNVIIGLSTHSYQQALFSKKEDLDYIGYGPVFKTKTKPLAEPIGICDLSLIKQHVSHPVFAIGGLNETNVEKVIEAGADGIAVVSAVLESSDVEKATKTLLEKIQFAKKQFLKATL